MVSCGSTTQYFTFCVHSASQFHVDYHVSTIKMVNYFIYAKDYSASTRAASYFHENGLKTLEQFKSDVDKIKSELTDAGECRIVYLHWGHECVEVNEETTIENYNKMYADGWTTLPETIIEWIKTNVGEQKIKLLYIITDGLIGENSLQICFQLNENVEYESVVFHAIHKNLNSINLSVAASFLKGQCKVYRNYELFDNVDISKHFDYDNITIQNFTEEIENLKSYIKLKFINSSKNNATALAVIDQLKMLRNRLFTDLSQSPEKEPNLDTKDKNDFLHEFQNTNWYKNLFKQSSELRTIIEKSISTLINYIVCEKKSYAFDALKFNFNFRHEVPGEDINDIVDVNFTTDQEIEFPDIILDDEKGIPVILLCTTLNLLDKIIFHSSVSTASFSKFKSTMECPLFLLKDEDLNETIGYFYTLNVYKQLLENTTKTEPRTRRPFHGGLVLVDGDDFDRYNDYILSATYFNFKKVTYNVGLFYFVLWKICENKEWMDRNVVEQFKKYMLRRISTTVCRIGLSSLPLEPRENTSLPTALWYCVELSTYIFKNDPDNFAHERLRMFYGIAHYMIEILSYLQYDLNLEAINKRVDLIRHVMILKKISTQREKVNFIVEKIFKKVDGFLVSDIENGSYVKKLNYLKINHKGMLNDDIILEEVNLNDYVHFLHHQNFDPEVKICEKTFRPFFVVNKDTSFYSEVFKKAKKVVIDNFGGEPVLSYDAIDHLDFSKMLSLYNLFMQYVKDCNKFPTLIEFKEFVLRKKQFKEDLVTIFPVIVCDIIEKVFVSYESVMDGVSVAEFIDVCNKYVSRIERIKAEKKIEFESDEGICKFISNEECKVKLIKSNSLSP